MSPVRGQREAQRQEKNRQIEQAVQERHACFKKLMQVLTHSCFTVEPVGDTYFYALRLTLKDDRTGETIGVYEIKEVAEWQR